LGGKAIIMAYYKKLLKSYLRVINAAGPFNLILISFFCGLLGQYFLNTLKNLPAGLALFSAGILFFILADAAGVKKREPEKIPVRMEAVLLLLIMGLGVFFRVYMTGMVPPGFFPDEAQSSQDALSIMNGRNVLYQETSLPVYIKGQVDNPAMILYIVAAIFKFAGAGINQARLGGAALTGILAIPAIYFLVRYLMGARSALIAAFLLAVMRWHVTYSRIFFHASFCVFIFIFFVYFSYKAYREKKWSDFILLGFTMGLTQYTYQPVKLLPLWAVIFGAYILWKDRRFFPDNYKKIIVSAAIFIVMFVPLGNYIAKNFTDYSFRIKLLSIFNPDAVKNWMDGRFTTAGLFLENTKDTLLMFNYRGDENPRHNYRAKPMLDFISGITAFLGFGFLLSRCLQPFPFFILSMFGISLMGSILNIATPHATRAIMAIPFMVIFSVIFLQKAFQYFKEQYGNKLMPGFAVIVSAALIFSGWLNFNSYFNGYGKDFDIWDAFTSDGSEAAKYLASLGPEWHGLVETQYYSQYYDSAPFNFVMRSCKAENYEGFDIDRDMPVRSDLKKNFVYLFPAGYETIVPFLRKMYPDGKYKPVYKRYNEKFLSFFSYEVPYKNVRDYNGRGPRNGLTGYYYANSGWQGSEILKKHDWFILIHHSPAVKNNILSIKWKGKITVPDDGSYVFVGNSEDDDYWDISIDGVKSVVSPVKKGKIIDRGEVRLRKGTHDFIVRCSSYRDIQKMKLFWIPPGSSNPVIIPNELLTP
jgi:4-amino-4-deoxy-L-arabinose transferase-like glycosyltransferase